MPIKKINAFTLIELIVVITIIGLLILATTVYLGGSGEKRKVIEGQGCAAAIGGEITNYVFNTLTSKKLKLSSNESVSPNYYIIQFTGGNEATTCLSGNECDKIVFSYSTGEDSPTDIKEFKTISSSSVCRQNKQPLKFYWSGTETNYIIMNKGLSPRNINNQEVFYLQGNDGGIAMSGDIIIGLCLNSECTTPKQIGKFVADARPQTISIKNCRFYDEANPTKCKEREK